MFSASALAESAYWDCEAFGVSVERSSAFAEEAGSAGAVSDGSLVAVSGQWTWSGHAFG